MNVYDAIMKAADSIESCPELFNFGSCEDPDISCGTPGCALGWIAHHAGIVGWAGERGQMARFLGISVTYDKEFYSRMDSLSASWARNAARCSAALRRYADEYHGDEKPKSVKAGIPDSVLDIFKQESRPEAWLDAHSADCGK